MYNNYSFFKIIFLLILIINLDSAYSKLDKYFNNEENEPLIKDSFFLTDWDVLAPFPSAPREDVDVLAAYGGITGIPRADNSTYPSDLVFGGEVGWTKITTNDYVTVNFTNVNWDLIESWAGSSGSYFSGWALSDFDVEGDNENYVVTCVGVSKFFVDDIIMQGDSYQLGLTYNAITLNKGKHTVRVRVIGSEQAGFGCIVNTIIVNSPENTNSFWVIYENTIVPDIVDNQFASPFISISVLNVLNQTINDVSIQVASDLVDLQIFTPQSSLSNGNQSPSLQPGQVTPINFMLKVSNQSGEVNCPAGTTYAFMVYISSELSINHANPITLNFSCKSFGEPFTFTFLDYDQSVQYAAATPPLSPCSKTFSPNNGLIDSDNTCPVLLTFHGAGVDAKSQAWTGAYQRQNYSWTLFPTNRANYGFDWESGGVKNAIYALEYLCGSLPGVQDKQNYQCDVYRLQIAGHSMGGHGAEHFVTTIFPDRTISLSVAAGWIDMKLYTPNFLRLGYSLSHPKLRYIFDAVVSENDSDFHSPHLINIPLIVRMGSDDDNVPPYHLRRLNRLYNQLNHNPTKGIVSEIPGEGHWFNGVVDDATMQAFFNRYILSGIPKLPTTFLVTCINPASFQGKGGIKILQLTQNYKVAKIKVTKQSNGSWNLAIENVRRFSFYQFNEQPTKITIVNGKSTQTLPYFQYPSHYCNLNNNNQWSVCNDENWQYSERNPFNYGPMVQIVEYPIIIVYGTIGSEQQTFQRQQLGVYLSNVWFYQLRYAVSVIPDTDFNSNLFETYNVIFMGGSNTNKAVQSIKYLPIQFGGNSNNISFTLNNIEFNQEGLGVLFLASCNSTLRVGCMVTVIEGSDQYGFSNAVQYFPTKSSFPMPDYIVLGKQFPYQGVAGAYALGFWDNFWNYQNDLSYLTTILND
ncbi:hypothetical protein DICPUDRAFT_99888 [Dictyostelium purpureum]|uniref:Peptidase S9 prolyl oligopeptidase catalytic domain-containing protein n=1 Tax=Dictyostelium purpureum TaxID=5786 RepID=F1A3I0_DICPU|nr:uncharacterized protein DICPUDRAFT_99888 [Dictyostelium purpureum]EGC29252.1 hypothetical protein DICPUDRAFT_99888 [Dictyostelium purpureum]|eukprot:XP_003294221.1 hypothetical protein DICPUDRAFT_99888 [Dictyostelium purpureum]